jgi:hypothetical protein
MTTTSDLTRLQELTDRADLTDLLTRQGLWLDERHFEAVRTPRCCPASERDP